NASCIAQPNLPISYSLIMRHEGSYSGFNMCKTTSNTKKNAANQNVVRAPVTEIAIVDLSVGALAIFVRPHLILVTAHPVHHRPNVRDWPSAALRVGVTTGHRCRSSRDGLPNRSN